MSGSSAASTSIPTVAVRFEGGIGDHVLGMRLLRFIRERYPQYRIIGYSDAKGGPEQLEVLRMSPLIDEVRSVRQRPGVPLETMGSLDNIIREDAEQMLAANVFFDVWGGWYFVPPASALGVGVFDIHASRPELVPPKEADDAAAKLLAPYANQRLVGMNLSKYGGLWGQMGPRLKDLLTKILADERVTIIHMYQTDFGFAHWPSQKLMERKADAAMERAFAEDVNRWNPRIVPLVNLPITTVAAVLNRCSYFIGVDNGIKHVAWALDVPRTLYFPDYSALPEHMLRWIPDLHRMLTSGCTDEGIAMHVADAQRAIAAGRQL